MSGAVNVLLNHLQILIQQDLDRVERGERRAGKFLWNRAVDFDSKKSGENAQSCNCEEQNSGD